jgi:hypothetical protein
MSTELLLRLNPQADQIQGMAKDLDLVGNRYNILNLVFFPLYIFVQLPSTVIVRKFVPRLCISILVTGWGAVMIVCFRTPNRARDLIMFATGIRLR